MKSWFLHICLFAGCVLSLPSCTHDEVMDTDSIETSVELTLSYASGEPISRDVASREDEDGLDYTTEAQCELAIDDIYILAFDQTNDKLLGLVEELEFVEELDGWYKVYVDSEEGYVSAEFAHVEESLDTAITMTELLYGMGVSDVRVELCEYAKQFVGNPYVWGGTSLTKGADCSGFVLSVYKKFGVKLPHYSVSQSNSGTKISKDELQAGDLIFYADSSGTINHVAIYLGGNQVIHASNPKSGIKISKYNYRTPVKYVRILQD